MCLPYGLNPLAHNVLLKALCILWLGLWNRFPIGIVLGKSTCFDTTSGQPVSFQIIFECHFIHRSPHSSLVCPTFSIFQVADLSEGPRRFNQATVQQHPKLFRLALDESFLGEVGRRLWPTARRHGVSRAMNQHVFQPKSYSKLRNINSCRILWEFEDVPFKIHWSENSSFLSNVDNS